MTIKKAFPVIIAFFCSTHVTYSNEPFLQAVINNNYAQVKKLIKENPALLDAIPNTTYPLHLASSLGHEEIIHLIIESIPLPKQKMYVNTKNRDGQTPLYWAIFTGQTNVIDTLIQYGANINIQDTSGKTPLHWAIFLRHEATVLSAVLNTAKKYNQKINVTLQDNLEKWTALHESSMNGNKEITALLIEHNFDVNGRDKDDFTPLHVASYWNNVGVMQELIEKKANIDAKSNEGDSPLHIAAQAGHIEAIKFLLESGANMYSTNHKNQTPIKIAIETSKKLKSEEIVTIFSSYQTYT